MAIRSAAISGLALATALVLAQPGRAQSFFSFYEMSPRQIVGALEENGYHLRGPMYRRGDVYICDVLSVSGRAARLIVDARDGRILERYAVRPAPRPRGAMDAPPGLRPPRDVGESADEAEARRQMALDNLLNPPSRVYGGDSLFGSSFDDKPAQRSKRHAVKKHKEPSVAKAPAVATPDATATDKSTTAATDKSTTAPPAATAAVAPAPTPEAKSPAPDAAKPAPLQAEAEKGAEPKPVANPKPDQPRKKLNDLPVGTLD